MIYKLTICKVLKSFDWNSGWKLKKLEIIVARKSDDNRAWTVRIGSVQRQRLVALRCTDITDFGKIAVAVEPPVSYKVVCLAGYRECNLHYIVCEYRLYGTHGAGCVNRQIGRSSVRPNSIGTALFDVGGRNCTFPHVGVQRSRIPVTDKWFGRHKVAVQAEGGARLPACLSPHVRTIFWRQFIPAACFAIYYTPHKSYTVQFLPHIRRYCFAVSSSYKISIMGMCLALATVCCILIQIYKYWRPVWP